MHDWIKVRSTVDGLGTIRMVILVAVNRGHARGQRVGKQSLHTIVNPDGLNSGVVAKDNHQDTWGDLFTFHASDGMPDDVHMLSLVCRQSARPLYGSVSKRCQMSTYFAVVTADEVGIHGFRIQGSHRRIVDEWASKYRCEVLVSESRRAASRYERDD
jgi:hypothetical protein